MVITAATVAAIAGIIEAVIYAVTQVDSNIASGLSNSRNTKLTQLANQLAKDIAQDEALVNRMLSAYQSKDADLLNQMINSSPFGSRFRQIKAEYIQNKDDIKNAQKELGRISSEGAAAQQDISDRIAKSQTSGEVITDLITGRASVDTSSPAYERTKFKGE